LVLLDAVKKTGWEGRWSVEKDAVYIDCNVGFPLDEYIRSKPLDYYNGLRLALCLGTQLAELSGNEERLGEKYGVLFFNVNDILVINEDWFLLTNLSKILPIEEEERLVLRKPLPLEGLLAPELVGAKSLPLRVHSSCAFYSLALLCLKALALDKKKNAGIDKLYGSKFYYLLQRCLERNPQERRFLYV
jgi:hypothetical protein